MISSVMEVSHDDLAIVIFIALVFFSFTMLCVCGDWELPDYGHIRRQVELPSFYV
jgi:hypothetical protein